MTSIQSPIVCGDKGKASPGISTKLNLLGSGSGSFSDLSMRPGAGLMPDGQPAEMGHAKGGETAKMEDGGWKPKLMPGRRLAVIIFVDKN